MINSQQWEGRRSTVRWSMINSQQWEGQRSTVRWLMINSQQWEGRWSTVRWSTMNTVDCWFWGGRINSQQWGNWSTVNSERVNGQQWGDRWSTVLINSVNDQHCWLLIQGGGSTVNSESVNSQIWNALPHFKIVNLFYLHLPINTFDIHNNAKFGLKRCTLTCPLPFNTLIYPRFHTCFANLCTWTLLVLDKALPMMHHDIPTVQLTLSSLHQLSIPPRSTVNSVDHWLPHCWPLIVNCLTVDHWPSHCWLLIVDCLTVDCWPSHCWLLTLSLLTVDPPPQINSQQCWSSIASLLTVDPLTVDCRPSPPTDSNFVIFNILMVPDEPPAVADAISLTAKCSFLTSQKALEIP